MKIISTLLISSFIVACSSSAADNTIFEASRDGRISSLASSACKRYGDQSSGCPGYGTAANQKYATSGDCEREFSTQAGKLWPDAECNNGQINSDAYETCEKKAQIYACSTGTAGTDNFFDAIAALDECKASKVCTDPAQ